MHAAETTLTQHSLDKDYAGKYLTFKLDTQDYGIEILKVREIIGMINITKVPRMPDYLMGVINLRGKVIPIVDLRLKFGLEREAYTKLTCIIVVEVSHGEQNFHIGVVVDTVNEVINFPAQDLEPVPAYVNDLKSDYIRAMGKAGGQVKILLEIDKILGRSELACLEEIN